EEMERSFLEYAMSVIVRRALPDARDGLKPVHRRILYGMHELGVRPDRTRMKCARITGEVMGKFHPHGEGSIYDALVRMAQPFSLRHPLIDFHGNYGSPDFPAAAQRYCVVGETRVRLADGRTVRIDELACVEADSEVDIDVKVLDRRGSPVVASKLFHSGEHPVFRVSTPEGYEVTGTANHPLLCLEQIAGVPVLQWRTISELAPGMVVVINRTPVAETAAMTEHEWQEATLLGASLATRDDAVVPEVVWSAPAEQKRAFVETLLGEAGLVRSRALAKQLQELLLELGVTSLIDAAGNAFLLRVDADRSPAPFVASYLREEGELEAVERWERDGELILSKIANPEVRSVIEPIVEAGWAFTTIANVEPAGAAPVYSVRVDSDDHSFLAGGFVNHNTECRLASLATHLLAGIDEDTVDFTPNYTNDILEPTVLPSRFPNLLVNGSQGIAVGMATNIPPHNLGEVIDATVHLIDNPEATPEDLMHHIKGPDFPTGGFILGRQGILDAYRTGRGSVRLRARAEIEETKTGMQVVVSELPYQGSVNTIATKVADLVNGKELDGIRDIVDLSAGDATKLVFVLKRDATANVVLNNLYKQTPLQTSFGVNMVALVGASEGQPGVPRTLNLVQMLQAYIDHQVVVITRRTENRLSKAQARAHIVEGLLKALDFIDQIIELIRGSADRGAARDGLMAQPFEFSEIQANHILDLTLARLTRLGRAEYEEEMKQLRQTIAELESILADEGKLRGVIKSELAEVKEKFATPRRTEITYDPGDMNIEDLIADDPLVVVMTKAGYVKTVPAASFRTQARGGRGIKGATLKEEDLVTRIIHTSAHAYLLFFSTKGKVYRLRAHEVPVKERTAKGTPIVNLLPLEPEEQIQAIIDTRDFPDDKLLFFATRKGQVKKTTFSEYDKSRRDGFIAINLKEGDELVRVMTTSGTDDIFMVSKFGQTIRFSEEAMRPTGRAAQGVIGMRLKGADEVVSCDVARDDSAILLVTDAGFGKRTQLDRFPKKGRGTMGVKGIKLTAKRGYIVAAFMVSLDDDIVCVSSGGVTVRMGVRDISSQGRDATGVRVVNLD
ncbi:MAG TPA: DNA gyrase subunit A, partial [Acidimicrobiales bacterium]|nr:DNA gyrase subunit A [Acidimicrobiales bacterium]